MNTKSITVLLSIFAVIISTGSFIAVYAVRQGVANKYAELEYNSSALKTDHEYKDSIALGKLNKLVRQGLYTDYIIPRTGVMFCEQLVPVESSYVHERLEWQFMFLRQQSGNLVVVWKRMGRYFPIFEHELQTAQMPLDLKYHFVIESFLNPRAGSEAGATGIAQLMPSEARRFNLLIIDGIIDESRQPERAIPVACAILKENYEKYHDWFLAIAAYNLGVYGVADRLDSRGINNFFDSPWPVETWHHVYRCIAMSLIYKDRAVFFPTLDSVSQYVYQPLKPYKITISAWTNLGELAELTGVSVGKLTQDYNPQLIGGSLPPGTYTLWFPPEHKFPSAQLAKNK